MTFSSIICFCEFFFLPYPSPSYSCWHPVASYSPELLWLSLPSTSLFPWIIHCPLLLTWPTPQHTLTYTKVWKHFKTGSIHIWEHVEFLWVWVTFLNVIFCRFIHLLSHKYHNFIFLLKINVKGILHAIWLTLSLSSWWEKTVVPCLVAPAGGGLLCFLSSCLN